MKLTIKIIQALVIILSAVVVFQIIDGVLQIGFQYDIFRTFHINILYWIFGPVAILTLLNLIKIILINVNQVMNGEDGNVSNGDKLITLVGLIVMCTSIHFVYFFTLLFADSWDGDNTPYIPMEIVTLITFISSCVLAQTISKFEKSKTIIRLILYILMVSLPFIMMKIIL